VLYQFIERLDTKTGTNKVDENLNCFVCKCGGEYHIMNFS